jgi:hypothetical protein
MFQSELQNVLRKLIIVYISEFFSVLFDSTSTEKKVLVFVS